MTVYCVLLRAAKRLGVVSVWIAGGLFRVSFRLVSFRFVSAMLLPVVYIGAVMQQIRVLESMGGCCCRCNALCYPWQGRENTGDGNAGRPGRGHNRRAPYAGST